MDAKYYMNAHFCLVIEAIIVYSAMTDRMDHSLNRSRRAVIGGAILKHSLKKQNARSKPGSIPDLVNAYIFLLIFWKIDLNYCIMYLNENVIAFER